MNPLKKKKDSITISSHYELGVMEKCISYNDSTGQKSLNFLGEAGSWEDRSDIWTEIWKIHSFVHSFVYTFYIYWALSKQPNIYQAPTKYQKLEIQQ